MFGENKYLNIMRITSFGDFRMPALKVLSARVI